MTNRLISALFIMILTSCGNEDKSSSNPKNAEIATKLEANKIWFTTNAVADSFKGQASQFGLQLEFDSGGKFNANEKMYLSLNDSLVYAGTGGKFWNGKWKIQDGQLQVDSIGLYIDLSVADKSLMKPDTLKQLRLEFHGDTLVSTDGRSFLPPKIKRILIQPMNPLKADTGNKKKNLKPRIIDIRVKSN